MSHISKNEIIYSINARGIRENDGNTIHKEENICSPLFKFISYSFFMLPIINSVQRKYIQHKQY